jgi:parvulin-like peptidyl-prolyl isomerase
MMAKLFSKTLKGFVAFFFISFSVSCGASQVDIEVGEIQIEREALIEWNAQRTGVDSSEISLLIETANEWIQNQALADFLGEYGATFAKTEITKARDQLVAAGLSDSDPRLNTYSEWQAIRNFAAQGGLEVKLAYEANKELLGHELCTSHILTNTRQEALEVMELFESGQKFEELALTFSTDSGSGANGGSLGCVSLGAFVPSFERAVLGAIKASKELVGPVGSRFGFHVIRIDKISVMEPTPFEQQGEGLFMSIMHLSSLTREIDLNSRYGTWDPVVGQIEPVLISEGL